MKNLLIINKPCSLIHYQEAIQEHNHGGQIGEELALKVLEMDDKNQEKRFWRATHLCKRILSHGKDVCYEKSSISSAF